MDILIVLACIHRDIKFIIRNPLNPDMMYQTQSISVN
jgi:hypothetical protein